MKNDSTYIALMVQCIEKIRRYIGSMDYNAFCTDDKTQSAVFMQFEQLGEMSKRVSENGKSEVEIPWKKISGFRDIIAHEYYDVALSMVWNTITTELSATADPLVKYLKEHPLPKEEV